MHSFLVLQILDMVSQDRNTLHFHNIVGYKVAPKFLPRKFSRFFLGVIRRSHCHLWESSRWELLGCEFSGEKLFGGSCPERIVRGNLSGGDHPGEELCGHKGMFCTPLVSFEKWGCQVVS